MDSRGRRSRRGTVVATLGGTAGMLGMVLGGAFPVAAAPLAAASVTCTPNPDSTWSVSSSTSLAQAFTSDESGTLTSIDLPGVEWMPVDGSVGPYAPLLVSLVATDGAGNPAATLATAEISAGALTAATWVPATATFGSPATVAAGTTYAVVLSSTLSDGSSYWIDHNTVGNCAGGGSAFYMFATNPEWGWFAAGGRFPLVAYADPVSGGGSGTEAAPTFTLTSSAATRGTCWPTTVGVGGTWVQVKANGCAAPEGSPGATLLGWATDASFPIEQARTVVASGWPAFDGPIDGVRMIFIPVDGYTLLTGDITLFPIWSS